VEKAIPQPVSDLIPEDFLYTPTRVLVNAYGYLCVVAEGSYYGVVLMDMDGRFEGFYASDRVQGDALTILSNLMRRFFTQAQKDKMQRMLPTEYSSLAMDAEGFLYTTSATTKDKTASIKKLSPSGTNILLNSRKVPYGDQETAVVSGSQVETQFTDLCVDSDGFISALDTTARQGVPGTTRKATSLRCSAAWGIRTAPFPRRRQWIAWMTGCWCSTADAASLSVVCVRTGPYRVR